MTQRIEWVVEGRGTIGIKSATMASLRVGADMLMRDYDFVDDFPSREVVQSGGLESYMPITSSGRRP